MAVTAEKLFSGMKGPTGTEMLDFFILQINLELLLLCKLSGKVLARVSGCLENPKVTSSLASRVCSSRFVGSQCSSIF